MANLNESDVPDDGRLLRALAEQLKTPLLQIATKIELATEDDGSMSDISEYANMAIGLLDGYLLSTERAFSKQNLELEPVAISSILYDTAQRLEGIARQYNCQVELHLPGKYQPVLTHKESLGIALTALGFGFIEAQLADNLADKSVITLAAHRTRYGIIAGVYGEQEGLSADIYRRAKSIYGRARQALPITPTSGAGVFLADSLLNSMSTRLHVSHHHKLNGLAATLLPSQQLNLV